MEISAGNCFSSSYQSFTIDAIYNLIAPRSEDQQHYSRGISAAGRLTIDVAVTIGK